jgi:hypothetical protein
MPLQQAHNLDTDPRTTFCVVLLLLQLLLLLLLQELVGGPEAFEPFMRHYLHTFALKVVDSQQFKAAFCDFFKHTPASECCGLGFAADQILREGSGMSGFGAQGSGRQCMYVRAAPVCMWLHFSRCFLDDLGVAHPH